VRLAVTARSLDRSLRPDVVAAHNYEALAACLAAGLRAPLLYRAHTIFGGELPTYFHGRPLLQRASGLIGEAADRLLPARAGFTVAVSPELEQELVRRGHPASRIRCITPGIDLGAPDRRGGSAARSPRRAPLGLDERAEVVGYAGNLDRYQGLEDLLDAMAIVCATRPEAVLLVVTASDPGPLREAAALRGIERKVCIRPHPKELCDVLDVLAATDLCVAPRVLPGGFPVKLLSYLAAGRPVVATRSAAAGLELDEVALVVPDRSPGLLAAAIARLLRDPEARTRMGQHGRRLAETRFSWERATDALEEVLASLALAKGFDPQTSHDET
jgi:glycosyltransferase involved in cell wall biosynthesis